MGTHAKKKKLVLPQQDDHLDLVPLIDCVFLILLFFMLVGRLSTDERTDQITVPPTKTAVKFEVKNGWTREVVNVFGTTQKGAMPGSEDPPRNTIKIGTRQFNAEGINDYRAYQALRNVLDQVYNKAEKYPDPKVKGLMIPKVIVEIRADADTEYRVIRELQQVLSGTMDLTNMQPLQNYKVEDAKPFPQLDFTTRNPNDG